MDRRNFLMAGTALLGRFALPGGIVAVAGCSNSSAVPGTLGFGGATMGTTYHVRVAADIDAHSLLALEPAVHSVLAGVDGRMSTYATGSELSRLNDARSTDWQSVSADTGAVLAHAAHTSRRSGGAFDATVGPLVNLWGFGPDGTVDRAPAADQIARMLERVGWRNIEIDTAAGRVRKTRPDAYLDLSGIAKGYGVDAAAELLVAHGITDFLVEVGGELAARGTRPGGDPWRVAVEQPVAGARRLQRLVDLREGSIATSGDYRNFFDDGGRHYSHTIDPRDGKPVDHTLASVSVIADKAADADAASTALMVMGLDAGFDWAREQGIAALFVHRDGARLRERVTPAFDTHLAG